MSTFARFSNEWVSPRPRTCAPPGRTCQIEGQHKRHVAEPEESLLADGSIPLRPVGVLRHSPWDALFIALALVHGLALVGSTGMGIFSRPGTVERLADLRAKIFSNGLSPGLAFGPGPLSAPGIFRARTRHHQPLRPALQPAVLQRRLPRRTPCATGRALDAIAGPTLRRRPRQPLAGRVALARVFQPQWPGTIGVALADTATVRAAKSRARRAPIAARTGGRSQGGNRRGRNVSPHGVDSAAAAAEGAVDRHRRQHGKSSRSAAIRERPGGTRPPVLRRFPANGR